MPRDNHAELAAVPLRQRGIAEQVGWLLLVCLFGLLVVSGAGRGHLNTGDTQRIVTGTRLLADCVRDGAEARCAAVPGTETETYIGTFPPLQYIPTAMFEAVGLDNQQTVRALAWLNLGCFGLLAGLAAMWARREPSPWPTLAGALLVSGPLVVYSTTGFGEMLAGTVLVGFLMALRRRRLALVVVGAFLVTISKETMGPFVVVLACLAGRDADDRWLPPARVLVSLVPGLIAGTIASGALNWIRYGSVWNERYLEPYFQARGIGRVLVNTGHLALAPGGGLAPYWPAFALLTAGFGVVVVSATRRRDVQTAVGGWTLLLVIAVFTLGIARWWAPFGWVAWGPRLLLPMVPGFGLLMVWIGGARLTHLSQRALLGRVGLVVIAVAVAFGAYLNVSGAWFADPAVETLRTPDEECPSFGGAGSDVYWRCFDHRAWRLAPSPPRAALGSNDLPSAVARLVAVGGGVALVVASRHRSRQEAQGSLPTS